MQTTSNMFFNNISKIKGVYLEFQLSEITHGFNQTSMLQQYPKFHPDWLWAWNKKVLVITSYHHTQFEASWFNDVGTHTIATFYRHIQKITSNFILLHT